MGENQGILSGNKGVKSGCGFRLVLGTVGKSAQAAVLVKASAKDDGIKSP